MIQYIVCCTVNLWHVSWSRDFQSVWSPPMRVSTWACTCSGPTAPPWGSVCRRHLEAPHPRDVIISTPWRTVRKPVWIRPGPENASLWNLQCTVVLRAATSSLAKKTIEKLWTFLEKLLSEFTFIPHWVILKLCHLVFRISNLLVNGTILYIDNKVSVKTNLLLNVYFRN